MIHDNVDRYWEVRCYKLLIVDPKDGAQRTQVNTPDYLCQSAKSSQHVMQIARLPHLRHDRRFHHADVARASLGGAPLREDTMILDLASLRTAVALRVLERLRPEDLARCRAGCV